MRRSRLVTITTAAGLSLGCGGLFGGSQTSNPPPPPPAAVLSQAPDGACYAIHHYECPPEDDITCNPPPPEPIDCPKLAVTTEIVRQPDGTCQASGVSECPPDWECHTPILEQTDCPEQLGEGNAISVNYPYGCVIMTGEERTLTADCPEALQRPQDPNYTISRNDNGTCTAFFDGDTSCPEDATCNPPPPLDVPCPPE